MSWVIALSRACFDELQRRNVLMWLVLDYFCDGVYILDVVVRLHTGTGYDLTQILMTELKCLILTLFFDLP